MDKLENCSPFQIISHRIIDVDYQNDFITLPEDNSVKRNIQTGVDISDYFVIEENQIGILRLSCEVTIKRFEERKLKNKLICKVVAEGVCRADIQMTEDEFKRMMKVNGAAALYSITRGFIISLTSQAFPDGKVIIPLINFVQKRKD